MCEALPIWNMGGELGNDAATWIAALSLIKRGERSLQGAHMGDLTSE